ncbi:MAG: membrane protein [marine bacterium B5-7]|nr:MAG: membrane protein [marine bacterium B5-7]
MTEEIMLLISAMRDKRTPWYAKAIVILTLAYIISPIDIIPDFIPVIGLLDEIILIPIAYSVVMKLIPEEVKAEAASTNIEQDNHSGLKVLGIAVVIMVWTALIFTAYFLMYKQQFVL